MSDTPNYKRSVGRLVTDRFDFESHVNGTAFRHEASSIDVVPAVTIDGYSKSTVQSALEAISLIAFPPTIVDATASVKGIIKLTGDLGGTADSPTVTKIQGRPVNTTVPSLNQVLTWDGAAWGPSAATTGFTAGNDLSGSNVSQNIVKITGNGGSVDIVASEFIFNLDIAPIIKIAQEPALGSSGVHPITIEGQSSNFAGSTGGDIVFKPGVGTASYGNVYTLTNGSDVLFEVGQVFSNTNRVVSLVRGSEVVSGDVPDGDMVVYIGNAATNPTAAPSAGAILYASSGTLNVMQSDGVNFQIGSIPNPTVWGPDGAKVVSYRVTGQTTGAASIDLLSYTMPINTTIRMDVIILGKEVGSVECEQMNLSHSVTWDGGAFILIDGIPLTISDPKRSAIAGATWTDPDIVVSGASLVLKSGFGTTETINWMATVQIIILEAV